ncbi:MAG TPA: phosphoribosyltransferase family protein, partial [Phnomibacter sp.]|nr:phosphoribosyltransferase family protein [Phnomibacter sp.]
EALVPMPLNIGKLRQRGFNQADVLARGMADVLNIPVIPVAVIRSKYTQTQTRKSRIERWLNVEDVFELSNPKTLQHKHVLLVDDIITTGATMEACGQVLLQIEGLRLSVMSYAYAHRL